MREATLVLFVNALVPGGALPNGVSAPKASETPALARARNLLAHRGMAALEAAIAALPAVDQSSLVGLNPQLRADFAKVAGAVLTAYYETPAVTAAFGWRNRPPQPEGFAISAFDEQLLDAVRKRTPFWLA